MEDFGKLFLQLANILKPVDLPKFHGYNHEDPEEFLVRLTGTFAKHAIPEDKWTITAAGQLREEGKTWWVPYEHEAERRRSRRNLPNKEAATFQEVVTQHRGGGIGKYTNVFSACRVSAIPIQNKDLERSERDGVPP
ncbi:hypothetical protein HHI36_024416 [Cryptolaemus montrouzieri]|uniref:Gag protein n=1 Tax=Cryptolaemus montrouzieri TaxID=559131 RepID=A0ABD2NJ67_9CUCU